MSDCKKIKKLQHTIPQPDWNQNDSSKADYVKNRTHYDYQRIDDIVFDGSIEGRTTVDATALDMGIFYKISDDYMTLEEINGAVVYSDGRTYDITNVDDTYPPVRWFFCYGTLFVTISEAFSMDGIDIKEPGVYVSFLSANPVAFTIKPGNVTQTIDPKYISDYAPDSPADKRFMNLLKGVYVEESETITVDLSGSPNIACVRYPNAVALTNVLWPWRNCPNLKTIEFGRSPYILGGCFGGSDNLKAIILNTTHLTVIIDDVVRLATYWYLSDAASFENTPIAAGTAHFYVYREVLDSSIAYYESIGNTDSPFIAHPEWFRAIEDYPEILGE